MTITLARILRVTDILDPSFSGLTLAENARLREVDRECKDAIDGHAIWTKSLKRLEVEFPFVPLGDDNGNGKTWRETLGDPRYDEDAWEEMCPERRFRELIAFAKKVVTHLRWGPYTSG